MPDDLVHFDHRQRTTGIPDAPLDKLRWHIREASAGGVRPRGLHVAHDVFDGAYDQACGMPRERRTAIGIELELPGGAIAIRNNRRIWKLEGVWVEPRDLPDGLVLPVLGKERRLLVNDVQTTAPSILGPQG